MVHDRCGVIAVDGNSRLAGVGAVVFIHVLLIAFILSGMAKYIAVPRIARETIILLMPKQKPVKPEEQTPPRHTTRPPAFPYPFVPPPSVPNLSPSAPKALLIPSLRCAPENFEKLPAEEQAKCGSFGLSPPDRNTVAALRSHVRDPARHEAELAARNAPARVDCTRTITRVIMNIAQDNGVMVDAKCMLGHIRRALGH